MFCLRCKSEPAQPQAISVFALCADCVHIEWHRVMIPAHTDGTESEAYGKLVEAYGYVSISI